jgi:hypothetical protein
MRWDSPLWRHFTNPTSPAFLLPLGRYISGLKWAGGGGGGAATKLFTGSYDGSLRCLDLGAGGVSQLAFGDEDLEFSALDVTGDGRWARRDTGRAAWSANGPECARDG